ncbi:alpha/beta fold hydrolase BchO [Paragemmobacter straminiformis]|uniref:Alpha/beta fold hydrolase n=1 Tax=Paragemmobacter straminiformis TaxID=2045119 RepID=A0A842IB97_9RHOB|nr:alpha/beta fold hydrolase BchO [Gemmobacter straminiformis]MBC2836627.1 alpha/beta fold hydrolase [Gemmobacter straminiformis]
MDFDRMPKDWPYRDHARRVRSRPHDWCVIDAGDPAAPALLLLHGAGGSGHSFRHLIPLLAPAYRVIVPDLPGQGFTRAGNRSRFGLDPMAEDIATLCQTLKIAPVAAIGHSAGAAIALRLAEILPLDKVIGINAALGSFEGAAGVMFPLMARVLAVTPFIPAVVSRLWGNAQTVNRLLASTGSPLDAEGQAQYLTLVRDTAHVDGTLGMMAQWKLDALMARLPALQTPTLLIASDKDNAVPARVSADAARHMADARFQMVEGYGHLVHEEAAARVAALALDFLRGNPAN